MNRREEGAGNRCLVAVDDMTALVTNILRKSGCDAETAQTVARHLVEADLCGVESHGVMRVMQYVEQFKSGYMHADRRPLVKQNGDAWIVDGHAGIGITAMELAMTHACDTAKAHGMSAIAVVNCGHTGRLGAYAAAGANQGCLNIIIGGGGRKDWRMVVPYGGSKGMLPTNPYALGIPGGDRGPVVVDFATAKIAGGWIYSAKSAGTLLPEDTVIDAAGNPTRQPDDYFNGGAILSSDAKGYGLSVLAELIGEAMLGPVTTEMNWLVVCIDTHTYRNANHFQRTAEEILQELRECPPAAGVDRVEVPGERERDRFQANAARGISLPHQTWEQIKALAARLDVPCPQEN